MTPTTRVLWRVAALGLLLPGCADNPPVTIENRSVAAPDDMPEVRSSGASVVDYGAQLPRGPDYIVQPGDTLYAVAFRLGMDFRALAEINAIAPPYVIRVGQPIKTAPQAVTQRSLVVASQNAPKSAPATEPASSAVVATPVTSQTPPRRVSTTTEPAVNAPVDRWVWPARAKVDRTFSDDLHKGVDLAGSRGDPISATAAGTVVYAGTGVTGYGALLIVKHNETYLSAYGHNDALLVAEGERVQAGQLIARMGSSSTDAVRLHFEIRRNGRPVDPLRLLPAR